MLAYSVDVFSTVGKDTMIRVNIPSQALLPESPPALPKPAAPDPSATRPVSRLILLEDKDSVRAATELFLPLEGYDTLSVSSTAEFEKIPPSIRPTDILIADYHLDANRTGLDVLHQLRAWHP